VHYKKSLTSISMPATGNRNVLSTRLKKSVLCMSTVVLGSHAYATTFNEQFLSIDDAKNLDLNQFSRADYTSPGDYLLDVQVNDQYFGRQTIRFIADSEPGTSHACLPEELVKGFGLKPDLFKTLPRTDDGACIDLEKIDGVTVKYEKSTARLKINIPQIAFEYDDPNYIPRERWSDGVDGAMLDYHVIANTNRQFNSSNGASQTNSLQTYGTVGANVGAWRFRGDYQAQTNSGNGGFGGSNNNLQFNRLYAYRALTGIRSTVSIGNNYLNSDIFDTFDQTVPLGQVPANIFKQAGDRSPAQNFNIVLTDCDTTTAKNAFFTFTGTEDQTNGKLFATTGNATNVGIRLQSGSEYLDNGGEQQAPVILSNGNNTVSFAAMYEATAATVTPGVADSTANFTVRYQ